MLRRLRWFLVALVLIAAIASPSFAQEREVLGFGRIFSNDLLGDGGDRWRTGSNTFAVVQGQAWDGAMPDRMGHLLDYRIHTEIIAPSATGPLERPYVGQIALGLYSHSAYGPTEFSLGLDLVLVGPQTGISAFQEGFHDAFSLPAPRGVASQIGNAAYLGGTAQLVWPLRLNDRLSLRPFAEVQAGAEDLFRAGLDVIIGPVGQHDLWLRDVTTGQLYRGIAGPQTGVSILLGADMARVNNSAYLPESRGYFVQSDRFRARAGVHWQFAPQTSLFYGLTWLSPEFEGQDGGQILGSVKLNFNF